MIGCAQASSGVLLAGRRWIVVPLLYCGSSGLAPPDRCLGDKGSAVINEVFSPE